MTIYTDDPNLTRMMPGLYRPLRETYDLEPGQRTCNDETEEVNILKGNDLKSIILREIASI